MKRALETNYYDTDRVVVEQRALDMLSGRCAHGRRKYQCKDCGTGYCEHGNSKYRCRACGTGVCVHGNSKSSCRPCGTGMCSHGRFRRACRDCGTGICPHGKFKHHYADCAAPRPPYEVRAAPRYVRIVFVEYIYPTEYYIPPAIPTSDCEHGKYMFECLDCLLAFSV